MKIKLSPVCVSGKKTAPTITLNGLTLTVDNTTIDLSVIPEGGQAEVFENEYLTNTVTRKEVTIKYPYSTDIYEPQQSTNPADYEFEILSGKIPCPLVRKEPLDVQKH